MKKQVLELGYMCLLVTYLMVSCTLKQKEEKAFNPSFKLIEADKIRFNSFVDCNMAEA